MAVQYAPMKLRVPPGFQNLLEGLAREVLREQPDDIIVFAAQYFKNQLLIREETGKDDAKKGDQMERLQKGEEVDIDLIDPEVNKAATKIQASFRGHKAREDVKKQKEEEAAAIKIQAGFRGHQARERVNEIKASQSKEVVSESAEAAEADTLGKDGVPLSEEAVAEKAGGAEGSEEQEAADAGQVPDVQPDDAEVVVAEAVSKEPEVGEDAVVPEPVAEAAREESEDQERQEAEEETVDAADKGEAEDVQAEEAAREEAVEAAGKSTEVAEGAEESGGGVGDAQPDGAKGGEVEGEAEQVDLDMNDPDLQNAALKIQASFRGFKAREEVKAMKSSESLPQADSETAPDEKTADDKQDVTEGDEDKGNDDVEESVALGAEVEPSAAEDAEDPKPSED